MTTYEVYQPHTAGPEGINSAWVISRHRSPEAARRAIDAAQRRLRRQPGSERSWLDYRIRVRETRTGRHTRVTVFSVRPLTLDEQGAR